MLVEFFEDVFERDPSKMLRAAKGEDGEVVFEETGDPLIDKWEREMAQGITPDLTEGLSKEELAKLREERARKGDLFDKAREATGIQMTNMDDPRFQSKVVPVDSEEDDKLRREKLLRDVKVKGLPRAMLLGRGDQ